MLAYLDVLLGFSVVMLGISLLITILNQVVSAFLAHRGSNLRCGLDVLLSGINPGPAGLPVLTANASMLAETVLVHPMISDSTFSTRWADSVRRQPFWFGMVRRWRLANAIQPDELSAVLSLIAANRPEGMGVGLHAMLSAEIAHLLASASAVAVRQGQLASAVA